MADPKPFATVADFRIYRVGGWFVIYEGPAFFVQLRPKNCPDPVRYVERVIAARVEAEEDKEFQRAGFRKLLADARAKRAADIARQGVLNF